MDYQARLESACSFCYRGFESHPLRQSSLKLRLADQIQKRVRYEMWYVYVLRSSKDHNLYIGSTNDVNRRLREHNSGKVVSTKYRMPFNLEAYFAVKDQIRAIGFEQYLKSGSGRVFLQKRIL